MENYDTGWDRVVEMLKTVEMGEQKEAVSNSNIFDIKCHNKRKKKMRVGCRELTVCIIAGKEANPVTKQ